MILAGAADIRASRGMSEISTQVSACAGSVKGKTRIKNVRKKIMCLRPNRIRITSQLKLPRPWGPGVYIMI